MSAKPRPIKRCKICLEPFHPWSSLQKACGIECARLLARREQQKKERRETKLKLIQRRTVSEWAKIAQVEFNKFIKLRDHDKPCISCGSDRIKALHIKGLGWVASHYRSVGACPELRFNEDNVHKSCVRCNSHLSGNIVEYRIGLLSRIGVDRLTALEGPHEPKRYRIDELIRIRDEYRNKAKALKAMREKA